MTTRMRAQQPRDRGAVIPLTAMLLAVIVLAVAFAVDLGRQRSERRDMQAIADVVSLDLSRKLEGRDAVTIDNDPAFDDAVDESAARNDHPSPTVPCPTGDIADRCVTVTLGNWDDSTSTFTPCSTDPAVRASCIPDAVEVEAGTDVGYSFQPGSGDTRRTAIARVGQQELANFQIGSSLVQLNPSSSSVVGQILNAIAPGAQVLGWQGLADANVTLEELGIPLGVPITTASPQELLDTQVTLGELALAAATALENSGGDAADVQVLQDFANLEVSQVEVSLGEVLGLQADGGDPAAQTNVNAVQLLTAAAFLVDNEHFIDLPETTIDIPGVIGAQLTVTGVEAPQQGGNQDGATATTSQVSVQLTTFLDVGTSSTQRLCEYPVDERNVLSQLLGGLLSFVGCTLNPGFADELLEVRVSGSPTLDIDLAEVTAQQAIDCATDSVTITPTPSIVDVTGNVDLNVDASLAGHSFPVATLDVPVTAQTTGSSPATTFVGDPSTSTATPTGTIYTDFTPPNATVGSNPLGLANLLQVGSATLSSLGADLSTLTNAARVLAQDLLNDVLADLDVLVIEPLTELLGLNLGGSDITPLDLRCDESAVLLVE